MIASNTPQKENMMAETFIEDREALIERSNPSLKKDMTASAAIEHDEPQE